MSNFKERKEKNICQARGVPGRRQHTNTWSWKNENKRQDV